MKRYNLVESVRNSLVARGISTVKVVNAVNAALGELERVSAIEKLGVGSVTKKAYKVTNTVTEKYTGMRSMPLLFDAWHCKIEACEKLVPFEPTSLLPIPPAFDVWLAKMVEDPQPVSQP